MNKQELISKIAEDMGSRRPARQRRSIRSSRHDQVLKKGQPITFVGFGTFKTAQRKARTARNPQTGAAIKIPKRRVVRFTAGKASRRPSTRDPIEIRSGSSGNGGTAPVRCSLGFSRRWLPFPLSSFP